VENSDEFDEIFNGVIVEVNAIVSLDTQIFFPS
jgi:hypothetical protein